MKPSIIISQSVIDTVRALPETERQAIVQALANELFLGNQAQDSLSPFQNFIYTMISSNMQRDTQRFVRHYTA